MIVATDYETPCPLEVISRRRFHHYIRGDSLSLGLSLRRKWTCPTESTDSASDTLPSKPAHALEFSGCSGDSLSAD